MAQITAREQQALQTRARIAQAALELFVTQGYTETTIDQVAEAAGVGRRTVFRHFRTKGAMLFDHLTVRGDFVIGSLRERPSSEPPLVSLHAALRELCEQGYERRLLHLIRAVLATEPRFAGEQLSTSMRAFRQAIVAALQNRPGGTHSPAEIKALTDMAEGWYTTAAELYLKQGERTLTEYFDQVVTTCAQASALLPLPGNPGSQPERTPAA
jgi:AcrR family transcriptional regulator